MSSRTSDGERRACVLCRAAEKCRCPNCGAPYCSDEHRRLDFQFGHSQRCAPDRRRQPHPTVVDCAFDEARPYLVDDPDAFGQRVAVLGKGSYGIVDFRVGRQKGGRTFAVKEFIEEKKERQNGDDDSSLESECDANAVREISVARNSVGRSAYLAETRGAFVGKRGRRHASLLAMRLETGVTLSDIFSLLGVASRPHVLETNYDLKTYFMGILRAVAALHRDGVAHLDIKGNNIMVGGGRAVLMDLGLAWTPWTRGRRSPTRVFNADYRPPECCLDAIDQFDPAMREKGDVWALACVFLIAALGRAPFATTLIPPANFEEGDVGLARTALLAVGRAEDWACVFAGNPLSATPTFASKFAAAKAAFSRPPSSSSSGGVTVFDRLRRVGMSDAFVELMRAMLEPDPVRRISAVRAQAHPFFDDVRPRFDVESATEARGLDPAADEARDKRWAVDLIERMQLPPSDPDAAPDFARGENPASFSCRGDPVHVAEKAWSFFHRWNSRLRLRVGACRGSGMSSRVRFATCRTVARALFSPSFSFRSGKVKDGEEAEETEVEATRSDVVAMLTDLDHDLDRPTPIDCAYLILYCSKLRGAVARLDVGFDAFAHAVIVASILAGRMAHDPGMVVGERALAVAAPCIAYGLESAKAMHPDAYAAIESVRRDAIVPTTDSCAVKFAAGMTREFPEGQNDVVMAMLGPLRSTFYPDSNLDPGSIDMQISNAVRSWAAALFQ